MVRSVTFQPEPLPKMPRKPVPRAADRTPQARLAEGPLHGLVGYQLAQASVVTNRVFDDQASPRGGLRRVEYTILALVQANPDVTARQLARALAVSPPNIAIWLDRLEQRGWIARRRSESDARVQHIRLARTGAALVEQTTHALLEAEAAALASLTAAERAMLVELLHKVALARTPSTRGARRHGSIIDSA
jgi:DNA-binding MarR family transcriptional regulator